MDIFTPVDDFARCHKLFPLLTNHNCAINSPEDEKYNCAAFAIGIDDWFIWPLEEIGLDIWPLGYTPSLENFCAFLVCLGYTEWPSLFEPGNDPDVEAVALYGNQDNEIIRILHLACRRPNGTWASKLRTFWDIIHVSPLDLVNLYGPVQRYLTRPRIGPAEARRRLVQHMRSRGVEPSVNLL